MHGISYFSKNILRIFATFCSFGRYILLNCVTVPYTYLMLSSAFKGLDVFNHILPQSVIQTGTSSFFCLQVVIEHGSGCTFETRLSNRQDGQKGRFSSSNDRLIGHYFSVPLEEHPCSFTTSAIFQKSLYGVHIMQLGRSILPDSMTCLHACKILILHSQYPVHRAFVSSISPFSNCLDYLRFLLALDVTCGVTLYSSRVRILLLVIA